MPDKAVPFDIDVWRAANLLLDQRGPEGAWLHAAERADEMLARGDTTDKLIWQAILRAIEELQRTDRREGEAVN